MSGRIAALRIALCACAALACTDVDEREQRFPERTAVFLSEPLLIDQVYRSMKGPQNDTIVRIGDPTAPELVWVLGYETEIVDPMTGETVSDEFMCHNNLNARPDETAPRSGAPRLVRSRTNRLFTLSQGAMRVELPEGFGIPILSTEQFRLSTQVLNLNPIDAARSVRYRTTVRYVRDDERVEVLRPLYQTGLQGLKLLEGRDGFFGVGAATHEEHGESCSIGKLAGERTIRDDYGRSFAAHWVVEPGREENHTLVTEMLALERDTTVHHIAVHLHPFAESLELRDLTTGESIFKSRATNRSDQVGLSDVQFLSSPEGIRLFRDHEYTLISVYQNDSGEPQDAMAVMFLYLLDKRFRVAQR